MLFHDTQVAEESTVILSYVLFITNQCLKAGNFRCVLNEVRMLLFHMCLKCMAYLSKFALKEKKKINNYCIHYFSVCTVLFSVEVQQYQSKGLLLVSYFTWFLSFFLGCLSLSD